MLEGAKRIPVALFEPVIQLNAGAIYMLLQIDLQEHEPVEEWRAEQTQATMRLCLVWLDRNHEMVAAAILDLLGRRSYIRIKSC